MRPFSNVDILDLTQTIAGPLSTQMMAALGANVVKVEPPRGDTSREMLQGALFPPFNMGGKENLCIDLKTDEGCEIVRELAESADVVVESFRPGVVDRFGLDYESVSEGNKDVIYLSLTGFGQEGPYSEFPAYDPIIQALSGIMSVTGYPDRPPARIGASLIDCGTGANAAFLISSALTELERTGEGQHIDISLFDVAVSWMSYWIAYYTDTGDIPERSGSGFSGIAPNSVYYSGEEPFYLACVTEHLYKRLCETIDREDLIDDPRFETNDDRWENREALREELESTFAEYDRDELVEMLASSGVPSGGMQTLDEVVEHPHVRSREMLAETTNPKTGNDVLVSTLPFRTNGDHQEFETAVSTLGEQSRAILERHGYSEAEIDELVEQEVLFTDE